MQDSVTVRVDAPPAKVWGLVSDVTNTGRFSPETFEAEWLDGSTGPEVGARFRGHVKRNGREPTYWTKCTAVVASEPGKEFTFVVGTPKRHPMTWGYRFEAAEDGTDVTEFFQLTDQPAAPGRSTPRSATGLRALTSRSTRTAGRPAILVVLHPGTPVTGAP